MGKTMLLADAAMRARSAGMRVLRVTGWESESKLAFAGLHQLLRPVLPAAGRLPGRQELALLGALGLSAEPVEPDLLLIGLAVLTLLSDLSESIPLLVVADDAHWLDRSSLDALAFAAGRLDAEPAALLVGVRGQAPPPGFERGFPELRLGPLPTADSGRVLDEQPQPPRGRARAQVLAQAGGNPMALIELAKVIAADPAASRRWATEPLPLTNRLSAVLTARVAGLPESTRDALLLAAAADGQDLSLNRRAGAEPDARTGCHSSRRALSPSAGPGSSSPIRSSVRLSITPRLSHSGPRRIAVRRAAARPARPASVASGNRRLCTLTSRWPGCSKPPPGRRSTAVALLRRPWPWNVPLSSAPAATIRPGQAGSVSTAVPTGQPDWVLDLTTRAYGFLSRRTPYYGWLPATTPMGAGSFRLPSAAMEGAHLRRRRGRP